MKNSRVNDFWSQKAKSEGYPARSVYKLEEIDKKFKIFNKGQRVLDVGAAPGSWSMYACKKVFPGEVLGVDLKDFSLKNFTNFKAIIGDAFCEENMAKILENGEVDVLISDAAPNTTGNSGVDTLNSLELVESVIFLAEKILKIGGDIVVKLFQGGEEKRIFDILKESYSSVKIFKPTACRKVSFETYMIGKSKK